MMMQPQILHHSPWSYSEDMVMDSTFDQVLEPYQSFTMDDLVGDCVFSSSTMWSTPLVTVSEFSSIPSPSTRFTTDHIQYPIDEDTLQLPSLMELDCFEFGPILSSQITDIHGYEYTEESEGTHFPQQQFKTLEGSFPIQSSPSELEDSWSPPLSLRSEISSSSIQQPSLNLPQEGMEICNQVILPHLMEAYVESMSQGQKPLAEEILRGMSQKVINPLAESLERLASYLSQHMAENHGDYLRGEASKNVGDAFMVFQQLPHQKVANFAAVSAILEAIPEDCDVIHIVDFGLGHGAQWAPMIEAIAKSHKTLKLTSIRLGDGESPESVSTPWNFEETRRILYEHAKSCDLKLKVEEKGLEELVGEIKKMKKRGGRREFLAFNCMVGLLDLGGGVGLVSPLQSTSTRVLSRREHAMEFLKVAEDLIKTSGCKGIITFGDDGDAFERVMKNSLDFRSFIEGQLVHYQAWLESIESHFTPRFSEARTAIEVLFVAPSISSLSLLQLQTWEEMKRDWHLHQRQMSLEGCRLSKNSLVEVRELLSGSEGSYEARIEGQNGNVLVLEWKGTQLLRLSTWKN